MVDTGVEETRVVEDVDVGVEATAVEVAVEATLQVLMFKLALNVKVVATAAALEAELRVEELEVAEVAVVTTSSPRASGFLTRVLIHRG